MALKLKIWKTNGVSLGKTLFLSCLIVLGLYQKAFPFEKPTHVKITNAALKQAPNYSDFLLKFNIFMEKSDLLLKSGSFAEDDFPRPRHHFFDPTTGEGVCPITCVPSLEWAYFSERLLAENNEYSWVNAREFMFIGLTGKNFDGGREIFF